MAGKLKLAIEDCGICGGCEIAIADLGINLFQFLDKKADLVYAPILASTTDFDEADVTLVIGAIRNRHDLERVTKARKKSKILVAFGSCPASVGLVGLANLYDKEELLNRAYDSGAKFKHQGLPELLETVEPLSKHVPVDFVIPGCPPPTLVIKQMLEQLIGKM